MAEFERSIKKFAVFLTMEGTILVLHPSYLILLKNWFGRGISRWGNLWFEWVKIMSASFQQLYFLVKPWSRNCQNSIKTMYNAWKKCLFFVVFKMNDFVGCVDYYLNQFSYVIVLFHVLWQLSKKYKTQSRNLH